MNTRHLVAIGLLLAASVLPRQASASWTSKWITNVDRGANSVMSEASYACSIGGVPSTCHVLGVAYGATNGELAYAGSADDGQTFTVDLVEAAARSILVEGEIGLVFAGSTPLISYSGSNTTQLWTAKRLTNFAGNCGPNDRWSCVAFNNGVGLHLASAINASSALQVVYDEGGSVKVASRPTDYSSPFGYVTFVLSYFVQAVAVAINPGEEVFAAWASNSCVYVGSKSNTSLPPEVVECAARGVTNDVNKIAMAFDATGMAHVVYILKQPNGSSILRHAIRVAPGAAWQQETVRTFTASEPGFDPKLVLRADRQGIGAIAWGRERHLANGTNVESLEIAYPDAFPAWANPAVVDGKGGRGGTMLRLHDGRLAVAHYDTEYKRLRLSLEN